MAEIAQFQLQEKKNCSNSNQLRCYFTQQTLWVWNNLFVDGAPLKIESQWNDIHFKLFEILQILIENTTASLSFEWWIN